MAGIRTLTTSEAAARLNMRPGPFARHAKAQGLEPVIHGSRTAPARYAATEVTKLMRKRAAGVVGTRARRAAPAPSVVSGI